MPSRPICVGDLADEDDQVAWRVFTLMFTPVMNHQLHRHVASFVHGLRHCPERRYAERFGPVLCDQCADHVDAYRDIQFRKWRDGLSGRARSRSTELAQLVESVRSSPIRHLTAASASAQLLAFAQHHPSECPQWIRWAFFQLVHRPPQYLYIDIGRWEAARQGRSARPERDLTTAKWAHRILPDETHRMDAAEFVVRLRVGEPNPWQVHGFRIPAALRTALASLRALRPEFYNANVAALLLRWGLVSDAGQDLDRARSIWAAPMWTDRPEVDEDVRQRARTRIETLLAEPPRSSGRMRRLLGDICDTAFGRGTPDLIRSTETMLRLPPAAARTTLAELGRLVLDAGIEWVDDRPATP